MLFKAKGDLTVWDAERDRELCRFDKGVLETGDPRTCRILIDLGYEYSGEVPGSEKPPEKSPADNPEDDPDEELEKLRAQAKELKVRNWHTMSREGLEKAIATNAAKGDEQ